MALLLGKGKHDPTCMAFSLQFQELLCSFTVFHLKVLKLKVLKLKVLNAKGIDVLKVLNAKGIDVLKVLNAKGIDVKNKHFYSRISACQLHAGLPKSK